MNSLRRVAARAAPTVEVDQVPTSGAARSGPRPSHIRDAMRPASADLLLRLLSEVVNLLLRGELPKLVRPCVCGASWLFASPMGLYGLSLLVRPSVV